MGICDVIIDIITDVIDVIVDVITTIVDVVVGIIDAVLAPVANLLGFTDGSDGSDVLTFEVHNQNLFEKPDKKASAEVISNAIINSRDISADLLYAAAYQSGKRSVRKFVKFIDDGDYFEGFPDLKGNILTIDYDEIDDILTSASSAYNGNGGHGAPVTIDTAKLGTLFVVTWQKYWLQQNKSYVHETATFTHSGTNTVVNVSNSVFNSSNKTYTLRTGSPLSNFSGFVVPLKPLGLHYVVNYHLDSAPNVNKLFVYKVGAGTYTGLDSPSTTMTTAGSDTLSVLPAIPLRLNNTNFNASGQNTTKRDKIIALVDKVGLDAESLIATVMEDVSNASIAANKIDHVYLNFGVRFYDNSQIAMNYAFRFISTLFPGQGTTKAIYDATPSADVKPYNTLLVEADNYKFAFTYAYITFVNYSLSAINAAGTNSEIYQRYHSVASRFTGGYLNSTYYTSSGVADYQVHYKIHSARAIMRFLNGSNATGPFTDPDNGDNSPENPSGGRTNAQLLLSQQTYYQKNPGEDVNAYGAANIPVDTYNALNTSGKARYTLMMTRNPANFNGHVADEYIQPAENLPYSGDYQMPQIFKGPVGARVRVSTISVTAIGQNLIAAGVFRKDRVYKRMLMADWSAEINSFNNEAHYNARASLANWLEYKSQIGHFMDVILEVDKLEEIVTKGTSFTYYQNVVNGMNAYTVHSPKTMLRVVDAQTSKFKVVTFDLTNATGLMIPFSYEVIKDLPNDHVTSLFVASAHLSIYVADVQTITVPWWVKILKIVQVLLFLFAIITGQFATAQALIAMLKQIAINFLIKKAIVFIAKEISPELAIVVAIFMAYQMSGGEDIDFSEFTDVVKLLENTTDIMSQVYLEIAEDVSESLMAEQKVEDDARDQAIKLLEDAEAAMDTNSLVKSYRANLLPMMATRYYDYFNNFQTLAVNEYDYDEKINAQYNRNDM